MSNQYLICGATGSTGSKTVAFLLDAGVKVRAYVHRHDERSAALSALGAELVTGDLLDFEAVRRAMEGVKGAYFVYPVKPGILQATAYFAQAAKEVAVSAIVNMSQISARREAKSHAAQDHWISEQVLNWSGVPTTHLRPTLFAEWALYWTGQIKTGILRLPFGTGRHAPIAAEDQARVIAKILLNPGEHKGKVYPLYGEKEFTFAEIAAEIGKVVGKPVAYEQIDAWELKKLSANFYFGADGAVRHDVAAFRGDCERPPEWSVCGNERPGAEDRRKAANGTARVSAGKQNRDSRVEDGFRS